MPWVLWDIVVPLVLTFAIGLGTGWLLWRWRRHKVSAQTIASTSVVADEQALSASSATALIEERDIALARAEEANLRAETLAERLSQAIVSDNELDEVLSESAVEKIDVDTNAEVERLNKLLHDEQSSKSELEQAFMDLNNRYAVLSNKLDEAMDEENALVVKDAAVIQSKYDTTQRELFEIQAINDQQKSVTDELQKKVVELETELAGVNDEKNEALKRLEAATASQSQDTTSSEPTASVHHLSSYSRNEDASAVADASGEMSSAETSVLPASVPTPNPAADARIARGGGHNSVASAVAAMDIEENHGESIYNQHSEVTGEQPGAVSGEIANTSELENLNVDELPATELVPQSVVDDNDRSEATGTSVRTTATGYQPQAWEIPERTPDKSERDNLQKIKGVGPVLEKMLHKTGIFYFRQVALLDLAGVAELDEQLPQFSGRIQRDNWVDQAKSLHREKYGEDASR